ncbi:ABC transporter substrate-binding protein [Larsenimonas suaedae]|uniref:ABC transporter substrate-binding protein n=1 Tax=Larsenimonas suaedae TaxID=1851019 RepID=A0ABU1GX93_9GAMM|nr:ABC transporter substrate-binding protein [Larsenimonas suaedae]MCM2971415.1 ABC transporter substrate-binding protein [Larsenimonas suaedae]MDR5896671.1 ABC transporter substrate-binding protein [Larsenimonas suaedae]
MDVTDVTGRHVSLEAPAKRVILGEGRNVIALSLLTPQPSDVLVGWGSDFKRYKNIYRRFTEALPKLETIPTVGSGQGASDLSVEKIISLRPDVVILSRSQTPPSENTLLERQLEAAGITLVYVDFATDPAQDTLKSLQIMAKLIGRDAEYERFATFYRAKRQEVATLAEGIDPSTPKPLIFLEAHAAGMHACCYSPGDGSFQGFIDLVGGENLGGRTLKGKSGLLTPEYILASQPDIYIATGGSYLEGTPGMVLGPFEPIEKARASLKRVTSRDAIAQLAAVKHHRVHGLYHHLINTPYNIVVLELLAKWIHPDVFGELDPTATLDAINKKFAAVPLTGSLWIDDPSDTDA